MIKDTGQTHGSVPQTRMAGRLSRDVHSIISCGFAPWEVLYGNPGLIDPFVINTFGPTASPPTPVPSPNMAEVHIVATFYPVPGKAERVVELAHPTVHN